MLSSSHLGETMSIIKSIVYIFNPQRNFYRNKKYSKIPHTKIDLLKNRENSNILLSKYFLKPTKEE